MWLGNYGHLSYEKQRELIWELGKLDIGVGTLQATNSRIAQGVATPVDSLARVGTTAAACACR